jgi:O-antigen polymerase
MNVGLGKTKASCRASLNRYCVKNRAVASCPYKTKTNFSHRLLKIPKPTTDKNSIMIAITHKSPWLALLLSVSLAATLPNSFAFGGPSLIAVFLSGCSVALFSLAVFAQSVFAKPSTPLALPAHIIVFIVLALYAWLHGLWLGHIGLPHYQLLIGGLLLVSVHLWQSRVGAAGQVFIHWAIALLALLQVGVVLLQCMGILGVPGGLFLCTGTWGNPNVTALFLAFSLFSFLRLRTAVDNGWRRIMLTVAMGLISLTLLPLQCRSAWLVALVLLVFGHWQRVVWYVRPRLAVGHGRLALLAWAFVLAVAGAALFGFKAASAKSRLFVWQTGLRVAMQKPLTGQGFGQFEKTYNAYLSVNLHPQNDYVTTPYNDYLLLLIEGGVPALLLWVLFVILASRTSVWGNRGRSLRLKSWGNGVLPVLVAFTVIQWVNFGMAALPAWFLMLVYIGLHGHTAPLHDGAAVEKPRLPSYAAQGVKWRTMMYGMAGLFVAAGLLLGLLRLADALYANWQSGRAASGSDKVAALGPLRTRLEGYTAYHETMGDALREQQLYRPAIAEYQQALDGSHAPGLLAKCGYCYQILKDYDSSQHYYALAENIQPYKYRPRMAMLLLYEQMGDSARALTKAREILRMPVKLRNRETWNIKQYAAHIAKRLGGPRPDSIGRPRPTDRL